MGGVVLDLEAEHTSQEVSLIAAAPSTK